jgi:hypothetical protein
LRDELSASEEVDNDESDVSTDEDKTQEDIN